MSNFASILNYRLEYARAEQIDREVLNLRQIALGREHPNTIASLNNLSTDLKGQERYQEAADLLRTALQDRRSSLRADSPQTLEMELNLVETFAAQDKTQDAAELEQRLESGLLGWIGAEFYQTTAIADRRQLIASQSAYQDVAISIALLSGTSDSAKEVAANAAIHFKELSVEEEAFLTHLSRRSSDLHVRHLAADITAIHGQMARASRFSSDQVSLANLSDELAHKEFELGRVSREYANELQVRRATVSDLRGTLGSDEGLLEIRQYKPVDFKGGGFGKPKWAGILVTGTGAVQVKDLGSVSDTTREVNSLLSDQSTEAARDSATRTLYKQLIEPFSQDIGRLDRLYVAPDGILYLVPFGALRTEDDRRFLEVKDVRLLQTGRDLLRPAPERRGRGLVAMGGIDFGATATPEEQVSVAGQARDKSAPSLPESPLPISLQSGITSLGLHGANEDIRVRSFEKLPSSREEVEEIGLLFGAAHPEEPPPVVLTDERATKGSLTLLPQPPRVLHLATHGFYHASKELQSVRCCCQVLL
jgi:hypothetical protein